MSSIFCGSNQPCTRMLFFAELVGQQIVAVAAFQHRAGAALADQLVIAGAAPYGLSAPCRTRARQDIVAVGAQNQAVVSLSCVHFTKQICHLKIPYF
ncbi:hypothetical protein ACDT17_06615 [Chromobacterium piscinae]|uniref:hypothetical protein n=1 Tax=Chromobacterium piscinae TaxID=686831 RepID=UPI00355840E5